MLFEKAGAFEKAAEIHINTKNFAQAAPLMNSITTPKLHLLYAQAKEAEGDYIAACQAYENRRKPKDRRIETRSTTVLMNLLFNNLAFNKLNASGKKSHGKHIL